MGKPQWGGPWIGVRGIPPAGSFILRPSAVTSSTFPHPTLSLADTLLMLLSDEHPPNYDSFDFDPSDSGLIRATFDPDTAIELNLSGIRTPLSSLPAGFTVTATHAYMGGEAHGPSWPTPPEADIYLQFDEGTEILGTWGGAYLVDRPTPGTMSQLVSDGVGLRVVADAAETLSLVRTAGGMLIVFGDYAIT